MTDNPTDGATSEDTFTLRLGAGFGDKRGEEVTMPRYVACDGAWVDVQQGFAAPPGTEGFAVTQRAEVARHRLAVKDIAARASMLMGRTVTPEEIEALFP
jgi:hypothetical protein